MFASCLVLLLSAAPLPLQTGDELVFTGTVVDEILRRDHPARRQFTIEVRYITLAARPGFRDLATLTLLHTSNAAPPVAHLHLLRLGPGAQMWTLTPGRDPPPLRWEDVTASAELPPLPLDAAALLETGLLRPRPPGDQGTRCEPGRPPLHWSRRPPTLLHGAEVVEIHAVQVSDKWATATGLDRSWRRTERVWYGAADNLPRVLWRQIEHRDGLEDDRRITTRLDAQPAPPLRGEAFDRVRREIEYAWWFESQIGTMDARALAARIARYCEDYPATPYRAAVEAIARRIQ